MFKKIIIPLILCILILNAPITAHGETLTKDLFYLNAAKSVVVSITWETEEPDFTLISPDGTVYDPKVQSGQSSEVIKTGNSLFYLIENAKAGQWKITYDKKSNENITVSVDDYDEGLWVSDFNIVQIQKTSLLVRFKTGYGSQINYNYRLSLVLDKSGGEKVLAESSAKTNTFVEKTLDLSDVNSYDKYTLKLYVCFNKNGMDIFDMSYSEPFSYVNPDNPVLDGNFYVKVFPDANEVEVDWSSIAKYKFSEYLIALFEDGDASPAIFLEADNDITRTKMAYSENCKEITIELSAKSNTLYYQPLRKSITLDKDRRLSIEIPQIEVTNKPQLPFYFENAAKELATVSVNGKTNEIFLDGNGEKLIQLSDDWSDITVEYEDSQNVQWEYGRKVFVDRTPPVLKLLENYNNITTCDSRFTFVGIVSDCEALFINNNQVTINPKGDFIYEANLINGANKFVFVAKDVAGNQTNFTALVNKSSDYENYSGQKKILGGYLPLAISVGSAILINFIALIFWKKRKSSGNDE